MPDQGRNVYGTAGIAIDIPAISDPSQDRIEFENKAFFEVFPGRGKLKQYQVRLASFRQ